MKTSELLDKLAPALCAAQGSMKSALKDKINPAFRSRYADLHAVWDAARGPLTANGFSIIQSISACEGGIAVVTRILHSSGQWIESDPLPIPVSKRDAHGQVAAITYGKRAGLAAAAGIVTADEVDDDGNAAANIEARAESQKPASPANIEAKAESKKPARRDGREVVRAMAVQLVGADRAEQYLIDLIGAPLNSLDPMKDKPRLLSAYSAIDAELKGRAE
jgi:hypothetical protein